MGDRSATVISRAFQIFLRIGGRVARRVAMRLVDAAGRAAAGMGRPIETRGRGVSEPRASSADALVQGHFAKWSNPDHVNYTSMLETLRLLEGRPSLIVETGSSAWGTDSSRLFDAYVSVFGGHFWTVDLRLEPMLNLRRALSPSSTLACDDSVRFLDRWVREDPTRSADLVYLDSYDLDVSSPMPAAVHGLLEFFTVSPVLRDGSLLLIDDTPGELEWFPESQRTAASKYHSLYGLYPGKGMLIDRYVRNLRGVEKVHHRYQVLFRFYDAPPL